MLSILLFVFFERVSFFLVRTHLFLYSTQNILSSRVDGVILVHFFICLAYFFCIAGGAISAKIGGQCLLIAGSLVLYCAGALLVTLSSLINGKLFLFLGILLISFSAGCIKPNITTLGADLVYNGETRVSKDRLVRDRNEAVVGFFSVFYFVVNLSSFLVLFITPSVVNSILSVFIDSYAISRENLKSLDISEYFLIFFFSLLCTLTALVVFMFIVVDCKIFKRQKQEKSVDSGMGRKNSEDLAKKVGLRGYSLKDNIPLIIGWMIYDQMSSTWIDQGKRMNCSVDLFGKSASIAPSQLILLNSLGLLFLLPFYDRIANKTLSFFKLSHAHRSRMVYGLCSIGASYFFYFILEVYMLHSKTTPSILYQLPQILVITIGEALISVSGMAAAYNGGSASEKSIAMGYWYFNMAVGNLLVILLSTFFKYLNVSTEYQAATYLLLIAGTTGKMVQNRRKSADVAS
ncbi:solute carrier family 15 (oligopeptide transporter), member 1 [Nematocida minor]|uniref:solute carrier family 15 (oligopeptide transporter), member 1 n=1 Tax=Nematocida minor TaxID=1912983 RepID=UPI00221F14D8|nr:solute carrier family 15 (oligopeptide transporter), member 1 [Nematocida minor]KAI5190045.1 solute carrier family 15 (oligopeptide transporter), member 1 [Nematocida minor]